MNPHKFLNLGKKIVLALKKLSAFIKELTTLITTSFIAVIIVLFVFYRHSDISEFIMTKGPITGIGVLTIAPDPEIKQPISDSDNQVKTNIENIQSQTHKERSLPFKEAEIGNENNIQEESIK